MLLREFGGQEALPELESLLDDAEPHVQREATRAIALLGIESAFETLVRALERGTDRARTSIMGVLRTLPDEDAEEVLSYLVLRAPYRGRMWAIHKRAVDRLGSLGGRRAITALSTVLQRRSFWSHFRMVALHRLAIDALARIGTPEAIAVVETVAAYGLLLDRSAARARLAGLADQPADTGQPR
jgi:HEAT repeat protein